MFQAVIIEKIAKLFLGRISDELRGEVVKLVEKLEIKAKKTSNPFDDVFVEALKIILDMK